MPRSAAIGLAIAVLALGGLSLGLRGFLLGGGNGDTISDRARDRSFMRSPGKPLPVHPHRGERKRPRSGKALVVQSEPVLCTGSSSQVVQSNARLQITAPRAVIVRGGCHIKLVNIDLRANDGVIIEEGRLEMVNGSITARGVAIRVTGEGVADLSGVEIQAATGVEAAGQAQVTVSRGRIKASGAAVAARDRAQVTLPGTRIDGPITSDNAAQVTVGDDAAKEED